MRLTMKERQSVIAVMQERYRKDLQWLSRNILAQALPNLRKSLSVRQAWRHENVCATARLGRLQLIKTRPCPAQVRVRSPIWLETTLAPQGLPTYGRVLLV